MQALFRSRNDALVPAAAPARPRSRYLLCGSIALACCVPLLGTMYVARLTRQIERETFAGLNAIARLQADQIEEWLSEREGDLRVTMTRSALIENAQRPSRSADTKRRRVVEDLAAIRLAYHYASVTLLDSQRKRVLGSGAWCPDSEAALFARAAAGASVEHDALASTTDGRRLINFVAPLFKAPAPTPVGFVVACADLNMRVVPLVERWPTPSPSGETLLVARDQDAVVFLSRPRHGHESAGQRLPLARGQLPALSALFGDRAGTLAAEDYRGIAVFASYRPIAGTPWQLIAKIDRDEAFAPMWQTWRWIGAIALLAILSIAAALLVLWRQRERSQQLTLRAEKARSDQVVNDFFNLPFVGMAIISPETRRFTRFNDQSCVLTGYPRAEFYEKTFQQLTHPDDYDRAYAQIKRIGAGETDSVSIEQRLIRKDGSIIFVDLNIRGVRKPDGSLDYLLGTAQDITPRKLHDQAIDAANRQLRAKQAELESQNEILRAAQIALRSSNERHLAITRSSSDALINTDSNGIIVAWNLAAERIFGYQRDEIIGRTLACLVPPRYRDAHQRGMERLTRGGEPQIVGQVIELSALHKDGRELDIDFSLTRWVVADGAYFTATLRDISQRKATEQRLRLLSEAVRQSPEAIVITDTRSRIEFVNEAFLNQTGYGPGEIIGRNPRLLHSGKTPPETFAAMWAALHEGESWKGEFHNQRKDGSGFIEFARLAPIRQNDGTISHYLAIMEDITEKKRLGEELDNYRHHLEDLVAQRTAQLAEASLKAEAASRAKSAFLANMSHEIRTPMNAVVGLTHLLRNSEATAKQLDRLQKIDTAAVHLLKLLNNILDFSKIEANKMNLEAADFSLTALFDDVRSMIGDRAREKHLAVIVDLGDTPPWLHGDADRLRQALLNYASNAVKFTDHGEVALRATVLEENDGELLLRFAVADTGIGVAAASLPRLFQAFEQADTSTTRKYGGSGLGLAITRRLAQLMGGDVGVDSEPQHGSTFWFTARLRRASALMPPRRVHAEGSHEQALRRDFAGARILLADDVAVNLEVAQLLLHSIGVDVETAQNGQEAVDKVRISAYDLILMDIQMPLMNGLEATRAIRQMSGRSTIPILAMTANAFDEDRQRCLAAGMNDFVAKPVDPDTLYAVLHTWLAHGTAPVAPATGVPNPAPSSDRLRQLASIPGLDIDRVFAQLHGDEAKLERIISLFLAEHALADEHIAAALAAADLHGAEQRVHALKGSAGLIGATQVAQACAALLDAIRKNSAPELRVEHHTTLASALHTLLAGLAAAPSPTNARAPLLAAHADAPSAEQLLSRLERLLANGELRAVAFARDNAPQLREACGESADRLLSALDTYDFVEALAALRGAQR